MREVRTVPAAFFGMVLGLSGLGAAWRTAAEVWGLPHVIGEMIMGFATVVWACLVVLYILKWIFTRASALAELDHPIQCCFVGLIGVSTMLIGGAVRPYSWNISFCLFLCGAIFTLAFAIWRTGILWQGGREISSTTAVLYLPVVAGSFVIAAVSAVLGFPNWGQYAFGSGLFTWLAIESVLLNRLYNSPAIPDPLRSTIGVQLAPPAVGAVAYLSVTTGTPGLFAHALIGYALLQVLLLLRLLPWIWVGAFSPGYWAFSFGLTALATAPLRMIQRGDTGPIDVLAPPIFICVNIIIAILVLGTIRLLIQDKLFPRLPPPTTSSAIVR